MHWKNTRNNLINMVIKIITLMTSDWHRSRKKDSAPIQSRSVKNPTLIADWEDGARKEWMKRMRHLKKWCLKLISTRLSCNWYTVNLPSNTLQLAEDILNWIPLLYLNSAKITLREKRAFWECDDVWPNNYSHEWTKKTRYNKCDSEITKIL